MLHLLFSLLLMALIPAKSEAVWYWPFSRKSKSEDVSWKPEAPWCEKALGQDSPELLAFRENVENLTRQNEIWFSARSKKDKDITEYISKAEVFMTERLSEALFQETHPKIRSQFVSYLLGNWYHCVGTYTHYAWGEDKNKHYNQIQVESVSEWLLNELDRIPDYSAEDLERIYQSFKIFKSKTSFRDYQPKDRAFEVAIEEKFVKLISKKSGLKSLDRRWNVLGESLTPSRSLKLPGTLQLLAEESATVFSENKTPKRDVRQYIISWIGLLKEVNTIHWIEMMKVLEIFRSALLPLQLNEDEKESVLKALKDLEKKFSGNDDALLRLSSIQTKFFQINELPPQN